MGGFAGAIRDLKDLVSKLLPSRSPGIIETPIPPAISQNDNPARMSLQDPYDPSRHLPFSNDWPPHCAFLPAEVHMDWRDQVTVNYERNFNREPTVQEMDRFLEEYEDPEQVDKTRNEVRDRARELRQHSGCKLLDQDFLRRTLGHPMTMEQALERMGKCRIAGPAPGTPISAFLTHWEGQMKAYNFPYRLWVRLVETRLDSAWVNDYEVYRGRTWSWFVFKTILRRCQYGSLDNHWAEQAAEYFVWDTDTPVSEVATKFKKWAHDLDHLEDRVKVGYVCRGIPKGHPYWESVQRLRDQSKNNFRSFLEALSHLGFQEEEAKKREQAERKRDSVHSRPRPGPHNRGHPNRAYLVGTEETSNFSPDHSPSPSTATYAPSTEDGADKDEVITDLWDELDTLHAYAVAYPSAVPTRFQERTEEARNRVNTTMSRETARVKGLCYECHSPDHQVAQCPLRKQAQVLKAEVGRPYLNFKNMKRPEKPRTESPFPAKV